MLKDDRYEDATSTFYTHYLSGAFNSTVVDSSIDIGKPENTSTLVQTYVSDRRQFATNVSRSYLVREAKRYFRPGFLADIGGNKSLNRISAANKAYRLPKCAIP